MGKKHDPDALDPVDAANERDWVQFGEGGPKRPKKPIDPALARANAQAAQDIARGLLPQDPPKNDATGQPDGLAALLEGDRPQMELDASPAVEVSVERCGCGQLLGHATLGVNVAGTWLCPSCFMKQRSYDVHPLARAVNCNVCHRTSVDFTGRNTCSTCHSRGCTPLKASA